MDFFQSQEDARRRTKLLIIYFILAVITIIMAIYTVVWIGQGYLEGGKKPSPGLQESRPFWDWQLLGISALATSGVIFLGSAFKTLQLTGGGAVIAEELGGRPIDPSTRDPDERKLMNVVEEMAIASGIPAPEVYLLNDQDGINAFAAGRNPSEAVIGVTRGCMKLLTRDQLQGVVAHEFSHILNGDMKLNMRLIGVLHGILVLSIIGQIILRSTYFSGGSRRSNRDGGGAVIAIMLLGVSLYIIGYLGVILGGMIKSAISRQREYLADASAVQFTRHPQGIGGALQVIGGLQTGSHIQHPRVQEASHMFFANALGKSLLELTATHPPLEKRIKAILPDWDGTYPRVRLPEISSPESPRGDNRGNPGLSDVLLGSALTNVHVPAQEALQQIGTLGPEHIGLASGIHAGIPESWIDSLHTSQGAQALVFALLLAQDDHLRQAELDLLRQSADELTFRETTRLHGEIGDMHSSWKLALVDIAIPSLRRIPVSEYERFREITRKLIASDQQVDLFEFALQKLIARHLDFYFHRSPQTRIKFKTLDPLARDLSILLSTLASISTQDSEKAGAAFEAGVAEVSPYLRDPDQVSLLPGDQCGLGEIDKSLARCDNASPIVKRQLIMACARTVMHDEVLDSSEAELLRAIADTIGCPIPPFVAHGSRVPGS